MNLLQEESIRIHQNDQLRPEHALSLNNLAWMYLTAKDRNPVNRKSLGTGTEIGGVGGDHRSY